MYVSDQYICAVSGTFVHFEKNHCCEEVEMSKKLYKVVPSAFQIYLSFWYPLYRTN